MNYLAKTMIASELLDLPGNLDAELVEIERERALEQIHYLCRLHRITLVELQIRLSNSEDVCSSASLVAAAEANSPARPAPCSGMPEERPTAASSDTTPMIFDGWSFIPLVLDQSTSEQLTPQPSKPQSAKSAAAAEAARSSLRQS